MSNTFSIISDVLLGISAIAVAIVAFLGIGTWRKELAGKALFEASKKMMGLIYRVVDSYQWASGLMTYSTESIDRPIQANETDEMKRTLDEWYARNKRVNTLRQHYNELAEIIWEVRTLLGRNSSNKIDELLKEIKKEIASLTSAVNTFFEIRKDEVSSGQPYRDREFLNNMNHLVYQNPDSEQMTKLNSLISQIDDELSPFLRSRKSPPIQSDVVPRAPVTILSEALAYFLAGGFLLYMFFTATPSNDLAVEHLKWVSPVIGIILMAFGFLFASTLINRRPFTALGKKLFDPSFWAQPVVFSITVLQVFGLGFNFFAIRSAENGTPAFNSTFTTILLISLAIVSWLFFIFIWFLTLRQSKQFTVRQKRSNYLLMIVIFNALAMIIFLARVQDINLFLLSGDLQIVFLLLVNIVLGFILFNLFKKEGVNPTDGS